MKAADVPRDGRPLRLIIGFFDPLHAEHISRLTSICRLNEQLVLLVSGEGEWLLPVRARAELVAALGCVDYVIADNDVAAVTAVLQPEFVDDERTPDRERQASLIRHVISRHHGT